MLKWGCIKKYKTLWAFLRSGHALRQNYDNLPEYHVCSAMYIVSMYVHRYNSDRTSVQKKIVRLMSGVRNTGSVTLPTGLTNSLVLISDSLGSLRISAAIVGG